MKRKINIFRRPDTVQEVVILIRNLENQQRMLSAFQKAATRLRAPTLDTNVLKKCTEFIRAVDAGPESSVFVLEVAKLSLDELAFCSIAIGGKRLCLIRESFRACYVRAFMESQKVSCGESTGRRSRPEEVDGAIDRKCMQEKIAIKDRVFFLSNQCA
ncbi:hypothetical protein HIM_02132 [Hirsutella minnesotensis 3608]|nr:hypothetical protein HIM_02132 [Hirsutella minnesotensis 3608]